MFTVIAELFKLFKLFRVLLLGTVRAIDKGKTVSRASARTAIQYLFLQRESLYIYLTVEAFRKLFCPS
jgi:hypothetical protein